MNKPTQRSAVTVNFDIDGRSPNTELSHEETSALAQFFKRLDWDEVRGCKIDDGEAHTIWAAVATLHNALAHGGYAPR